MNKLLTSEELQKHYWQGTFPMADEKGKISWHEPSQRAVFQIHTYKPKKSLKSVLNSGIFSWSINHEFEKVIRNCAQPRRTSDETWLSEELILAYIDLHKKGMAHSIEIYNNQQLVGGLYGVHIGAMFFGESMFSCVSNASKVAFHFLMQILQENNFMLLDSQYLNDFTRSLGAIEINDVTFKSILKMARNKKVPFKANNPSK